GPGHAPASAQPNPNKIPPIKYRGILLSLSAKKIGFPLTSFTFFLLMYCTVIIPTTKADPINPYIWMDWKLNISYILNHDAASDLYITIPKKVPMIRYTILFIFFIN